MASRLRPNASTAQINEFLEQLRIPGWVVHPKLVEFNNAKDQERKITLLCNKLVEEGFPEDAAINQSKELADADIIQVGIQSMRQSGSILMVCGIDEKDLEQTKSSEESTRHVQLVFLKEKKVNLISYFCISSNIYSSISTIPTLHQLFPEN